LKPAAPFFNIRFVATCRYRVRRSPDAPILETPLQKA
jgi:hypothetical protein